MGGMMAPQNVFGNCARTLGRNKLKLCDFWYQSMKHQKSYFRFPRLSGVTIAASLSICFLITKSQKFSKGRSDLIFEKSTSKYL